MIHGLHGFPCPHVPSGVHAVSRKGARGRINWPPTRGGPRTVHAFLEARPTGTWLLPPRSWRSDPNSDSRQRSIRTPARTSVASRKLPAHDCASINRRTPAVYSHLRSKLEGFLWLKERRKYISYITESSTSRNRLRLWVIHVR